MKIFSQGYSFTILINISGVFLQLSTNFTNNIINKKPHVQQKCSHDLIIFQCILKIASMLNFNISSEILSKNMPRNVGISYICNTYCVFSQRANRTCPSCLPICNIAIDFSYSFVLLCSSYYLCGNKTQEECINQLVQHDGILMYEKVEIYHFYPLCCSVK